MAEEAKKDYLAEELRWIARDAQTEEQLSYQGRTQLVRDENYYDDSAAEPATPLKEAEQ